MNRQTRRGAAHAGATADTRADRIFNMAFIVALALLAYIAGSLMTVSNVFPAPAIARAYEGGKALYDQMTSYRDVYMTDLWKPERRPDKGVTMHEPGKAYEGFTLYTSGSDPAAFLIDMDGEVVHEWRRPFSTVWTPGTGTIEEPRPDEYVHFRHARILPGGELLALYEGTSDTPYGYGLVKLDKDSNVIWFYPGRAHHQFDVAPDGTIYVLTQEIVDAPVEGAGHLTPPRLDDFLVVLSPQGEELRKIHLIESVARSRYRHLLSTVSIFFRGDPLHANTVEYIDERKAANFAFGEEGQVLLSLRELSSALAVIDVESGDIRWATTGPWAGQHDPDIQPEGTILLFDNLGQFDGPEGSSRALEFDPATMEVVWQYAGSAAHPLASEIRSDLQRLPNGNTLISESDGGRIVEVTREGEIAWEFMNPVRGGEDGKRIPVITWAMRLSPEELDPALASDATLAGK